MVTIIEMIGGCRRKNKSDDNRGKIFAQGDQNLLLENILAPLQLIFITLATRFITDFNCSVCVFVISCDFLESWLLCKVLLHCSQFGKFILIITREAGQSLLLWFLYHGIASYMLTINFAWTHHHPDLYHAGLIVLSLSLSLD